MATNPIPASEPADDLEWTELALRGWGLYQRRGGLRFSIDAVLLAHFVQGCERAQILDACTGTGVVAFILAARFPQAKIEGITAHDVLSQVLKEVPGPAFGRKQK